MNTYYLKSHVVSNSTGSLYGLAGTSVKVLSQMGEHVNVVNVEDPRGNRFPVKVDVLSAEPVEPNIFQPDWAGKAAVSFDRESFMHH